MIAGLTLEEIKSFLNKTENWQANFLAEVVCSVYWGGAFCVNLRDLDRLDADNFDLAMAIMSYRRTADFNEREFYDLATWCRATYHGHVK